MAYVWLNKKSQREVSAIASGYHRVSGTGFLGYTVGADPTHQNYVRQVLGKGEWHRVRAVYWEGFNVPTTHYEFFAGADNNETNTFFDRDSKHPGFVLANGKVPEVGLGTVIKSGGDSPELFVYFCDCELFPDFDENGNQLDKFGNIASTINEPLDESAFFYTVNPANVRVGWLLKYAETYNRFSWDWAKWVAYRDFCASLETVDYRVIPNLKGFGLSAQFFDSTDFTNEFTDSRRVEPYVNFVADDDLNGSPAHGIDPQAFSARYEGFIKPEFTEEYTFLVARDDSAKVWIDNVLIIDTGEFTGTANLTAGQFHTIKIEWINASGEAELVLSWSSTNTPQQVIKTEHLYPKVEQKERYPAHVAIISPATPAFVEPLFDRITNATTQKIDGKIVYECFEQKQITFELLESDIIRKDGSGLEIQWERTENDIQANRSFDVYEAIANDLDDRYLNPFSTPVSFYKDASNIPENPKTNTIVFSESGLYSVNMTRWHTFKILKFLMAREITKDLIFRGVTVSDRAYPLQGGDLTRITLPQAGLLNQTVLILESDEENPEKENTRKLDFQVWFDPSEFQQQMELSG
jgi:hypothetical protein